MPLVNGQAVKPPANGIANASVADDAANAVAESHWDGENGFSISRGWVDVTAPRNPSETDTGLDATPAAAANTQSWADEQPDASTEVRLGLSLPLVALPWLTRQEKTPAATTDANDGFHQVQRNRSRQEREGGTSCGRGRGEWRGRGRGDGRGRGRGRGNGGMPSRSPRRSDES